MANQRQGARRQFSWKFLLLTCGIGGLTFLILLFSVLENFLPTVIGPLVGTLGLTTALKTANKIFNENLLTLLKNLIDTPFTKFRTTIWPAEPPQATEPREPILEGPYDFAIFYKTHNDGEQANTLIRNALQETFLRHSLSEPAVIQSIPWSQLTEFASRWQNAIDEKQATHYILVLSDEAFFKETDANGHFDEFRRQICAHITKQADLAYGNRSLATLISLNSALETEFHSRLNPQKRALSSARINISQWSMARDIIAYTVSARHCDTRLRRGNLTGAAPLPVPPPVRIFNTRRGRNDLFIDRSDCQVSLLKLFQDIELKKHIQILTGPVGCGKTQIALDFAYTYYQGDEGDVEGNYSLILWLDAENSLEEGLKMLSADLTSRPGMSTISFTQVGDMFQWFEEQPVEKHWLLIIDRCKDTEFSTISPYLADLPAKGHVIITLDKTPANIPENASCKSIEYMDEDMAVNLLARTALGESKISVKEPHGIQGLRADLYAEDMIKAYWEEARALVKVLGYHPLLIHYAGTSMNASGDRPRRYQIVYLQQFETYITSDTECGKATLSDDICRVLSLWKIRYNTIGNPVARDILRLCAFLSTERIPDEIMNTCPAADQKTREEAFEELKRRVILSRESYSGPFYSLYRLEKLVRDIIHLDLYDVVDPTDKLKCQSQAILTVSAAFAETAPERYDYYRPHIGECVGYLQTPEIQEYLREPSHRGDAFHFLASLGRYYLQHPEKESLYCSDKRGQQETRDVSLSARPLFDLALQLCARWDLQDATATGLEPLTLAEDFYTIALFYHKEDLYRNNLEHARDCYRKAADLVQQTPGTSLFLNIQHNLGRLYSYRQDYLMAEQYFHLLKAASQSATRLQQAEFAYSQATNQMRKAYHLEDQDTARSLYIDAYTSYHDILTSLQNPEPASAEADLTQRTQLSRMCRTARLVLLLQRPWLLDEGTEDTTLEREIEESRLIIESSLPELQQKMEALDYLQLISDLNTLAAAYCELAQQRWQRKVYLEKAAYYSLKALGIFHNFVSIYPQRRQQGQYILQHIKGIYQQSSRYSEKNTRAMELLEQILDLLPVEPLY